MPPKLVRVRSICGLLSVERSSSRAMHLPAERSVQQKAVHEDFRCFDCQLLAKFGHQVRAEKLDFSKTTRASSSWRGLKSEAGIILAWLDGYYKEEDDPPIFDTDKFEANAKKFATYCAAHPGTDLITAADELLGN